MIKYYSDSVAGEDLVNRSVCIKEGKVIRKIDNYAELEYHHVVFVDNVEPFFGDLKVIEKGEMVRYAVLNISFR